MKRLFTIDYKDYKVEWPISERPSARAIILMTGDSESLNPDDKIALVYAKKLGYYKFPGGGIKRGEDNISALIREVEEEIGLEVDRDTIKEYGLVRRIQSSSFFSETTFVQDSMYYFCRAKSDKDGLPLIKKQRLDNYEDKAGFELKILSIREAVEANVYFQSDDERNLVMIARDTLVMTKLCGLVELMPRSYAEYLLEKGAARNPGPWREHSYAVAQAAEKIAWEVNKKAGREILNQHFAYIAGLLHDIGRQEGYTYLAHVYDGYHYLSSLGFEDYARICLTHSFNLHTISDYIGKVDISEDKLGELERLLADRSYDDYDRLIQLLDATCGADGSKNLENRMNDVKARYGYYPQGKWDKNFELKEYFEKLMCKDFYEVIS